MLAELNRILATFPSGHLAYCFAYGSGVFRQAGRTDRAMVDLMFVVRDTVGFHRDNLAANPGHYSAVRLLGPSAVAAVQTCSFGANVYFNTHVRAPGSSATFKYGVVDARDFARDLRTWSALYAAGRLHKPVLTLRTDGGRLAGLVRRNLASAAHAALLTLPDRFPDTDLYAAVAGLSYTGDFRMIVGEDKNKVANIVGPQTAAFRALYAPALASMAGVLSVDGGGGGATASVRQDAGPGGRLYHLERLPRNLRRALLRAGPARELAGRRDLGVLVRRAVRDIVFGPSLAQSLKGIATAGPLKSVVYSCEKLRKMFRSMAVSASRGKH